MSFVVNQILVGDPKEGTTEGTGWNPELKSDASANSDGENGFPIPGFMITFSTACK